MKNSAHALKILIAEDDAEDRMFIQDAFSELQLSAYVSFLEDGEALLRYLHGDPPYEDPNLHPRPNIILMDLNMPRKDGREALREIKTHPELRSIPVIIFSTSSDSSDISQSYQSGANSYLTKPVRFQELVSMLRELKTYWLEMARLPDC